MAIGAAIGRIQGTLENVARRVVEFPGEDTSVIAARVGACATSALQTIGRIEDTSVIAGLARYFRIVRLA